MTKIAKLSPNQQLDLAVLEGMAEPIAVQVTRIKNNQHMPIPLPAGEDGTPGVWNKAEVRQLADGWLVKEWSGGGLYLITITDSTQPQAQTYTWRQWYPPAEYPERVPPPFVDSARMSAVAPAPQPQPAQVPIMGQFPSGLPTGLPAVYAQAPQVPAVPAYPYTPNPYMPSYPPSYQPPGYQFQAAAQDAERRRLEERLAATEAQLNAQRVEAAQRQHQIDLERERAANAAAVQRLEAKIAELMQAMTAKANTASDPQMELLKEQNRVLAAQAETERREREMERRERETREMIAQMKAGMDAQITAMQNNFQQLFMNANKSDPLIQLMMQQSRDQIASMERMSGQSQQLLTTLQPFMMNPMSVAQMVRESTSSVDTATDRVARQYENILNLHGKVIENVTQLQPAGSPGIDLIREGVGSVKELVERYVTTTNSAKKAEAQAQAQAVTAQAQAQAIRAQADVEVARATVAQRGGGQLAGAAQPRPVPQPTAQPVQSAQPQTSSYEEWRKRREAGTEVVPQPRETVAQAPQPTPTAMPPAKPTVMTDEQWFGPALMKNVKEAREAVAEYIDELRKPNPKPTEDHASASKMAAWIMQAAVQVQSMGMNVPAMKLLEDDQLDEFVAVLLPNAPEMYRADVVKHLLKLSGDLDEDEDEDDDTEDEDGTPNDNVRDGASGRRQRAAVRVS